MSDTSYTYSTWLCVCPAMLLTLDLTAQNMLHVTIMYFNIHINFLFYDSVELCSHPEKLDTSVHLPSLRSSVLGTSFGELNLVLVSCVDVISRTALERKGEIMRP